MSNLDKTTESELVKIGSIFIDTIGRVGAIDIQPDKCGGLTVRFTDNDSSRVIWFSNTLDAVDETLINKYAETFRRYDKLEQSGALDNFYRAFFVEQERLKTSTGMGVLGTTLREDSIYILFKKDGLAKNMEISLSEIESSSDFLLISRAKDFFKDFN